MKKTLLFLSAIIVAGTVSAQQGQASVVFEGNTSRMQVNEAAPITNPTPLANLKKGPRGAKTTTPSSGRWYNYGDFLTTTVGTLGTTAAYMWNDTTSMDLYGSPTQFLFNKLSSVGMVWDPFISLWNDAGSYNGMIDLEPTNAYTVDSIYISGIYYRNSTKTAPVDTLTIAVLYGDGTTGSDLHAVARDTVGGNSWIYNQYGVDTLYYMRLHYDSVHNHADTFNGGFTPVIKKIYLTSADTSGNYEAVIPFSINVPAGSMPAVSVSFKSGDASFTFGDTVFNNSAGVTEVYKYGMFRPFVQYEQSAPNSPIFPTNTKADQNQGEFELLPAYRANHVYYPHWFLLSSGTNTASTWQYPYFAFHANCPSCSILGVSNVVKNINSASAYPSPANGTLTITYSSANATQAQVSLVNIMGQKVASQWVSSGKAIFNTSSLAAGVYYYTIEANGERYVNRVVISH
jgi:hypothetical protein